jgi:hypothetical protein
MYVGEALALALGLRMAMEVERQKNTPFFADTNCRKESHIKHDPVGDGGVGFMLFGGRFAGGYDRWTVYYCTPRRI